MCSKEGELAEADSRVNDTAEIREKIRTVSLASSSSLKKGGSARVTSRDSSRVKSKPACISPIRSRERENETFGKLHPTAANKDKKFIPLFPNF